MDAGPKHVSWRSTETKLPIFMIDRFIQSSFLVFLCAVPLSAGVSLPKCFTDNLYNKEVLPASPFRSEEW